MYFDAHDKGMGGFLRFTFFTKHKITKPGNVSRNSIVSISEKYDFQKYIIFCKTLLGENDAIYFWWVIDGKYT